MVATELLAQVFEVAAHGPIEGAFIANALGGALAGLGEAVTQALFAVFWWAHILLVAAVPGLPAVRQAPPHRDRDPEHPLRKLAPRGQLPAMDLEAEDAVFGVRTVADLSWKDLLDGFTCTECGRCQQACPAYATGKPLNPKTFIMGIRHEAVEAEAGLPLIPNCRAVRETYGLDDGLRPEAVARPLVDTAIPYDAVWDCLTCGACVEACPVIIEHVDKIVGLRRNLVLEDSRFPQELTGGIQGHGERRQPVGPAARQRAWTGPGASPFPVRTVAEVAARPAPLDEPGGPLLGRLRGGLRRPQPARRAGGRHLPGGGRRLVRRPGPGGDLHRRSGAPHGQRVRVPDARRAEHRDAQPLPEGRAHDRHGLPALLQHARQRVRPAGRQLQDPPPLASSSRTWSTAGRLVAGPTGSPAALGHVPRLLLPGALQRRLSRRRATCWARSRAWSCVEMESQRPPDASAAAPAAGGCGWRRPAGTRINAARTLQVLDTGAATVATACPFCMVMLRDGLTDAGRGEGEGAVSAQDISELLAAAIAPFGEREAPAGRRAAGRLAARSPRPTPSVRSRRRCRCAPSRGSPCRTWAHLAALGGNGDGGLGGCLPDGYLGPRDDAGDGTQQHGDREGEREDDDQRLVHGTTLQPGARPRRPRWPGGACPVGTNPRPARRRCHP